MSRKLVLGLMVAVAAVAASAGDALAQAAGSTYLINVQSTKSGNFDAVLNFSGPAPVGPFYAATGITSLVADDLSIGAGAFNEFGVNFGFLSFSFVNAPIIVGDGYTGSFTATQFRFLVFGSIEGEGSGSVGDSFFFASY